MRVFRPPLKNRIALAVQWPSLGLNVLLIALGVLSLNYGWAGMIFGSAILAFLSWGIWRTFGISISVAGTNLIVRNQIRSHQIRLDEGIELTLEILGSVYPVTAGLKISSSEGVIKAVTPAVLSETDRNELITELREMAARTGARVNLPDSWPGRW